MKIRALCVDAGMTDESTTVDYLRGVFWLLKRKLGSSIPDPSSALGEPELPPPQDVMALQIALQHAKDALGAARRTICGNDHPVNMHIDGALREIAYLEHLAAVSVGDATPPQEKTKNDDQSRVDGE